MFLAKTAGAAQISCEQSEAIAKRDSAQRALELIEKEYIHMQTKANIYMMLFSTAKAAKYLKVATVQIHNIKLPSKIGCVIRVASTSAACFGVKMSEN